MALIHITFEVYSALYSVTAKIGHFVKKNILLLVPLKCFAISTSIEVCNFRPHKVARDDAYRRDATSRHLFTYFNIVLCYNLMLFFLVFHKINIRAIIHTKALDMKAD
jgi:hypothetical protein